MIDKNADINGRPTVPGDREDVELIVRCDEAVSLVADSEFFRTPEYLVTIAQQRGLELSIGQFIHPDDLALFREKLMSCSFLMATHCRVRVVQAGTETEYDCRFIQYPNIESKNGVRMVKLAFNAAVNRDNSVSRCRSMLETMPAAVWEYDRSADIIRYTPVSAQSEVFSIPGLSFIDLLDDSLILHPDFRAQYRKLRYAFNSGTGDIHMDLKLLDMSGDYRWYTVTGTMVTDDSGRVTGYVGQLRNTDSCGAETKSNLSADDDHLTGLLNRHGMERSADRCLAEAESSALILLDVDDFNIITDDLGRHFSDALLIEIADILRGAVQPNDLVCRVSKDIFGVLLVNPKSMDAVKETTDIVNQALACCYLDDDRTESATCCMGVAYDISGHLTYEQLYYRADTAMAFAKCSGSNNVVVFHDDLDYSLSQEDSWDITDDTLSGSGVTLISQVVDVLFKSCDLESSINTVLSHIGGHYNITREEILEFSDDYQDVYSTYRWNPNSSTDDSPVKRSVAAIEEAVLLAADGEYFVCRDVESLAGEHPAVADFYRSVGARSFMHVPVRDGSSIAGLICIGFSDDAVLRRSEAVRELVLIAKILSGYITRLKSKLELERFITTDTLTGCFNYGRFVTEAEKTVTSEPNRNYVIVYSDIDRFKVINETFGFLIGDTVLIEFSRIVSEKLNKGELIGRIDADKFVMLIENDDSDALLERLVYVDRMINSLSVFEDTGYKVPLRCGICTVGQGENIASVIDKANLARKSIKNTHISTYTFFDEGMKSRIIQQKEIENVMYDALRNGEFIVYLQPKFSLASNSITGAEALVRWNRPGYGMLKPDEFIRIFEDNGFIVELDFYVMECVCRKLRSDLDRGLPSFPISVNFSRVHLKSKDFIERLQSYLDEYDLPENVIEVEITESALVGNEDYLVDMMTSLHKIGLVVSMDDFGSGYSTLNLLKKFPVDVLKIDKDFFTANGSSERERCIIKSVVSMAKELNISVVSEGVETPEQAEFLKDVNCDIAQGFLYARPMAISDYELRYQCDETDL